MNTILRLENAALAVLALYAYQQFGFNWLTFAIFILAPDIAALGYLINPRVGAICYNLAHSWILAAATVLAAHLLANDTLMLAGLIWAAHIGLDRSVGYGLKRYSGFKDTHLGAIGK